MSTLQVDRIIPYQSSSVLVEGLSAPNLATTGSNTFVGDQDIQGTITASIQEGFALVGGVGDVSTLVATSSFGSALDTSSLATTGSNTFVGNQTITGSLFQSSSVLNEITKLQIANSTKGFFGDNNTLLTLVGDSAVSSDMYVDGGNFDTLNILINQNAGTQFRDFDGSGYPSWLRIPTNTGNNPSPIFTRGLQITGSVSVSGSALIDLDVVGAIRATGSLAGQRSVVASDGVFHFSGSLQSLLRGGNVICSGFGGTQFQQITVENDEGTLQLSVDGNGSYIGDYNPNTSDYSQAIKLQPFSNYGVGQVQVLRRLEVTGSVNVSDVLQLAQKDPLPAGAVGQLAVSGSNLYYNNGATWTQIN